MKQEFEINIGAILIDEAPFIFEGYPNAPGLTHDIYQIIHNLSVEKQLGEPLEKVVKVNGIKTRRPKKTELSEAKSNRGIGEQLLAHSYLPFATHGYAYSLFPNIILSPSEQHYTLFFSLRLKQLEFHGFYEFLHHHLKNSFDNDLKKYKRFLEWCIREHSNFISPENIETIRGWIEDNITNKISKKSWSPKENNIYNYIIKIFLEYGEDMPLSREFIWNNVPFADKFTDHSKQVIVDKLIEVGIIKANEKIIGKVTGYYLSNYGFEIINEGGYRLKENQMRIQGKEKKRETIEIKPIFTNPEEIFDLLKSYFKKEDHSELIIILKTGNDTNNPLPFLFAGGTLCDCFKQLYAGQFLIIAVQRNLENWISKNFCYINTKGEQTPLIPKYVSRFISGTLRPAKGKRLIDINSENGKNVIVQLQIKNRKQDKRY